MKRKRKGGNIGKEIHSRPYISTDRFLWKVAGFLFYPFFLILFPIILLIDPLDWRLQAVIASRFACRSCGTILGIDALYKGKEEWMTYVLMWHEFGRVYNEFGVCDASNFNSRKFCLNHPEAVCCKCGVLYYFDVHHLTFKRQGLPVFNNTLVLEEI